MRLSSRYFIYLMVWGRNGWKIGWVKMNGCAWRRASSERWGKALVAKLFSKVRLKWELENYRGMSLKEARRGGKIDENAIRLFKLINAARRPFTMKSGMRWKTINSSPVHTCNNDEQLCLSLLQNIFPALLFMFSFLQFARSSFPRSSFSFSFIIKTIRKLLLPIARLYVVLEKGKRSSAEHAPYQPSQCFSPLQHNMRKWREKTRQDRMEKRQLKSIFHHNTNEIDLIIRADAIFLPVAFHSNVFFLPHFLRFISSSCVCVIVAPKILSLYASERSRWKKSKPCFSLSYLACQCVGCQLCILFFASGLENLNLNILLKYFVIRSTSSEREKLKLNYQVNKIRLKVVSQSEEEDGQKRNLAQNRSSNNKVVVQNFVIAKKAKKFERNCTQ